MLNTVEKIERLNGFFWTATSLNFSAQNKSLNKNVFFRSLAWEAHIYFSGTLFLLLAAYCAVNLARYYNNILFPAEFSKTDQLVCRRVLLCRLHMFSRLFSRGYFVTLNVCLIILVKKLKLSTYVHFPKYNSFFTGNLASDLPLRGPLQPGRNMEQVYNESISSEMSVLQ